MTTIVMNTLNGAVTEYDWAFQSITPTHAGAATGLYALGGDTDAGAPITGEIRSGFYRRDKVLMLGNAYVAMNGENDGDGVVTVQGRSDSWEYPAQARSGGVAKAKLARGIRENILCFGYRNAAGSAFHISRIDIDLVESNTRRI